MSPLITCMGKQILTYARLLTQPLIIAIALITAACTAPRVETSPTRTIVLAVATWNMDAGRGDLPRLIGDLETGRLTPGRPEHVALLLQEAVAEQSAQLNALAAARSWQLAFVPVAFDGRRTRGNAIMSSLRLEHTRAIELPRERQPRGAVAAAAEVAGQQIFLVSAHLENRVSLWRALFSDIARRRQAEALIAELPVGGFGVLGGDFNAWLGPNEAAWDVLLDRFDDTPGVMRTATFRDRLVLDHLLFDLPDGWSAPTAVSRDRYGSDHHPVVAAISASSREGPR
jgi:endonuclease/exonuclease/phosphatase family metal-dependent hydrolase